MLVSQKPERYLSPKELSLEFEKRGISGFGPRQCRSLVHAILEDWGGGSGVLRGTHCRFSVAYGWLLTHSGWVPFSRVKKNNLWPKPVIY